MLAGQEKDSGTLAAIVDFFVKSIYFEVIGMFMRTIDLEINIVFIVVCYVLGHVFPIFKQFQAYGNFLFEPWRKYLGLWNIFFMHLVEQCLRKPEETTSYTSSFRNSPHINFVFQVVLLAIPSEEPDLSFGSPYYFLNNLQHRSLGYLRCDCSCLSSPEISQCLLS